MAVSMHTTIYFKLQCNFLGAFRLNISAVLPGGYRNKGGDNYNCAYATSVNFHVFMKYVAPTKFTRKSS